MPLCRAGLVYSHIRLHCLHYFIIGSENGAIQSTVQRVNSYDTVVAFSFFLLGKYLNIHEALGRTGLFFLPTCTFNTK